MDNNGLPATIVLQNTDVIMQESTYQTLLETKVVHKKAIKPSRVEAPLKMLPW